MPQLVRGGKNTYGWSKVNESGRIAIPPDTYEEYNFKTEKYTYLLSGSKKSGGFGLTTLNAIRNSFFSEILIDHPELLNPELISGKPIKHRSRIFCIVPIEKMSITVPLDVLDLYHSYRHEVQYIKTVVLSPHSGVVTIVYIWDSISKDGVRERTPGAITLTCRKENEAWKIVHYHGSHAESEVIN